MLRDLPEQHATLQAELAESLVSLNEAHHGLGERHAALDAITEAVELFRELSAREPGVFERDLIEALDEQANRLGNVGRHERALEVNLEAVERYRRIDHELFNFQSGLARSLNNLSKRLLNLGRLSEALAAARESVGIRRELVNRWPDDFFQSALAISLTGLAQALSFSERHEEALGCFGEAVERFRQTSKSRQQELLSEMCQTLDGLAVVLNDLGRHEEALEYARAAVSGYRDLGSRPGSPAKLSLGLLTLGTALHGAGHLPEALEVTREALAVLDPLAAAWPDVYLPALSRALNNMGVVLRDLGQGEEARNQLERAVEIRRALADSVPSIYEPFLAGSLSCLAAILDDLGELERADRVIREAIDLQTRSAESSEARVLDLAISLVNSSIISAHLGRALPACRAAEKAVHRLRPLVARQPETYGSLLASAIDIHVKTARAAGIEPVFGHVDRDG
jgi:tetratricopeptide (TPR) repeat protein